MAKKWGKGDEELAGIALMAMCEAIVSYPEGSDTKFDDWVTLHIRNTLLDHLRRQKLERDRGLSGGNKVTTDHDTHHQRGRRVTVRQRSEVQDVKYVVAGEPEDTLVGDLNTVIATLPAPLRPLAYARWVDRKELAHIAEEHGITYQVVQRRLKRAETYARLHLQLDNSGDHHGDIPGPRAA